jgi:hypothetical protein
MSEGASVVCVRLGSAQQTHTKDATHRRNTSVVTPPRRAPAISTDEWREFVGAPPVPTEMREAAVEIIPLRLATSRPSFCGPAVSAASFVALTGDEVVITEGASSKSSSASRRPFGRFLFGAAD